MNVLKAVLKNEGYIHPFTTYINNDFINYSYEGSELILIIKSRKGKNKIKKFFYNLISLMYLYQGYYPLILKLYFNSDEESISDLSGKFFTDNCFRKISHSIVNVNGETISEKIFLNLKKITGSYLYSFEYITSQSYSKITANHKIMILLHSIEGGYINSKYYNQNFNFPKKLKNRFERRIYFILKDFFYYDKILNVGLLKLLKISRFKMINILADTRNETSHNVKHPNSLKGGDYMIYYFYILYYAFRIFLINELGLNLDVEKIKNYFYEIYDWLNNNLYQGRFEYKTGLAQLMARINSKKN